MASPDDKLDLDELERSFHGGTSQVPEPQDARRVDPLEESDDVGDLHGTVLAQRLARRRGYGVAAREPRTRRLFSSWALALLACVSLWSLWGLAPDLRYFLSGAPPVDLGHLGDYHPEAAPEGAFVRATGIASPRRGSWSRFLQQHEVFPLIGSRILVDRARLPDESLRGYGFQYKGEGRLSRVREGGPWSGVREQFAAAGEFAKEGEVYVIEDGLVPRHGLRIPAETVLWSALALFCLAQLARRLLRGEFRRPLL